MGAPKLHGPRVSTAVRFSVPLHERMVAFAETQGVDRNRVVVRALEEFLDRQDRADRRAPFNWSTAPAPPAT